MKKIISFVLALIFIFSLSGCKQATTEHPTKKLPDDKWHSAMVTASVVENEALFSEALNASTFSENQPYRRPIFLLDTKKDLDRFLTAYSDTFSGAIPRPEITPFEEQVANYDKAFFKDHSLLVVYTQCGSISYGHDISDICCDGKSLCVHIKHTNDPDGVFCAIGAYYFVIEIEDDTVKGCKTFNVEFDAEAS